MKKIIYILIGLFAIGSYAQGGPKVDVIKFRGEVTTTVRNTFDVPTGETWLIWNETEDKLELAESDDVWKTVVTSGTNNISEGIYLKQSDANAIEILPDGSVGGTDYVRIRGGENPNEVYLYLTNNYATLEGYSNADIDATGDNSITTKRWVDSKAVLKTGSTMSGTLSMGSNPIDGISNLTYSGYIDGANELRLTPDNGIGSTSGKNSFSFKTGNVAFMKKMDATPGLGLDYNALTTSKNLTFTDTDVLWGAVSLVSSSGSLLASSNVWTGESNTFENAITLGGALGDGGQIIMVGEGVAETSQMVFYDNAFTSPLAALGYNTTQSGIFLANTTSAKFLTLEDSGDLTYNGDIDITGTYKINGVGISGGISDGDKGDITVSSGVWTIESGSITSAKIVDGTIVNGDIADGTINFAKILDATITGAKIASNTISDSNIDQNSIKAATLNTTNSPLGVGHDNYVATYDNTSGGITFVDPSTLGGGDTVDATSVDAAGAVMNSDTSTASMSFVVDDDTMTGNSDTKVPTEQAVKAYVDANAATGINWEVATEKTLGLSDAGKLFYNSSSTDYVMTLPTNADVAFGEDVAFTFVPHSTGKIQVIGDDGVTFSPTETTTENKPMTVIRRGSDNWITIGTFDSYTPPTTNIYATANSISPIAEANATTGVVGNTGSPTITSVTTPKTNGTHAVQITTSTESVIIINRPTGFAAGVTYNVSLDISYNGAETGIQFYTSTSDEWNAVSDVVDVLNGTYTTYTLTGITCTSIVDGDSGRLRIYVPSALTMYIDNIIWTE